MHITQTHDNGDHAAYDQPSMAAVVQHRYATADVLELREIPNPRSATTTSSSGSPPPASTAAPTSSDTSAAITHLESGRTRGKIAIAIDTTEER